MQQATAGAASSLGQNVLAVSQQIVDQHPTTAFNP